MRANLNTGRQFLFGKGGLTNEAYSNKIQAQIESTYCSKQGETSMKWLSTCYG